MLLSSLHHENPPVESICPAIWYFYHKDGFKDSIAAHVDLVSLKHLEELYYRYSSCASDVQYSEALREAMKYNSKYIVATQGIKNYESFTQDRQNHCLGLLKECSKMLKDGNVESVLSVIERTYECWLLGIKEISSKSKSINLLLSFLHPCLSHLFNLGSLTGSIPRVEKPDNNDFVASFIHAFSLVLRRGIKKEKDNTFERNVEGYAQIEQDCQTNFMIGHIEHSLDKYDGTQNYLQWLKDLVLTTE